MQSILVTGATGYIGSNVACELCRLGYEVHILVRQHSSFELLENIKEHIFIHVIEDITKDISKLFIEYKIDAVIHLASLFITEHQIEDINQLIQSNIALGTFLLEAASQQNVKYFINVGTYWQNYQGKAYSPVNLYAATKEAFETIAQYYLENSQLRLITLKLVDTYGPCDPRKKIMNLLKETLISEQPLDMSEGNQQIGLVYIDDVIKAFVLAVEKIQTLKINEKQTYLVAPKEIYTLREVVTIFETVSGHKLNINWGKRAYKKREVMKVEYLHPNILQNENTTSLYEGISKLLKSH